MILKMCWGICDVLIQDSDVLLLITLSCAACVLCMYGHSTDYKSSLRITDKSYHD